MLAAVMTPPVAPPHDGAPAGEALEEEPPITPLALVDMMMAALEEVDYGVMVIDAMTRRLQHANRLALAECRGAGTLMLERGRIQPRAAGSRLEFERALGLVASDRRSLVSLRGERGQRSVSVVPLPAANGAPLALLMFGKQAVCEPLSVGFYARLHALTPTEEAVLRGLCRGHRPSQIAAGTGVAISTVRTQISSIRMKTRSASIDELVRTMSRLPPINPVMLRAVHAAS